MNEMETLLKKFGFDFEKKTEDRYTKYTLARGDYFDDTQLRQIASADDFEWLEANLQGEMVITISNARVKK